MQEAESAVQGLTNPLRLSRNAECNSRRCGTLLPPLTKLIFLRSGGLARRCLRHTTTPKERPDEVRLGVFSFVFTIDLLHRIRPGQDYVPIDSVERDPFASIMDRGGPSTFVLFSVPHIRHPGVAASSGKCHRAAKPAIGSYPTVRVTIQAATSNDGSDHPLS